MFDKIIKISLENKLIVLVCTIILLAGAMFISVNLPVDVFPDLTAPTVTILTEAHGMAAEEVEFLVTFPIETSVNGATGVRRVRSSSAAGISIVWVEFEWDMDIFIARQIVNEKLQIADATLPTDVDRPVLMPISSIMGEIMLISVGIESGVENPSELTQMELRTIADWNLKRRLLSIPGVSQVLTIGGELKQYQVMVSPEKLAYFNLSFTEVMIAAEMCNTNSSGGTYMDSGQEYLIRGIGRIQNVDEIKQSVITTRSGVPVLIGDVADVKIGSAVKYGDGSANGKPSVILTVQKQPNANTLDLTEKIEETIADIRSTLPSGISIDTSIFKQSDFISIAISNVLGALQNGAILVIIVLIFFLGSARTTFISVMAIPISISITIIVFALFDISINTMTLGGIAIAIGALVDDAIIDVENVHRRLKENNSKPEAEKNSIFNVILNASMEIRSPMVNATFIIVIVFVPLFFLSGVEGRLLRPMGYAYVTSIFASLLVALSVIPMLCYYLLPRANFIKKTGDSPLVKILKIIYSKVLNFGIKYPSIILAGAVILLIVSIAVLPYLGRSFLPEFNEGSLTLSVNTLPGTSIEESNRIGSLTEKILLSHPEVQSTARRTGRAELDEHAQGVYGAEIDVRIDLKDKDKEDFSTN